MDSPVYDAQWRSQTRANPGNARASSYFALPSELAAQSNKDVS